MNKPNLNHIAIIPTNERYADQMEELTGIVYNCVPRETFATMTNTHYRQQIRVFPEGQFIAVDTTTDRVVGLTVSMRTRYNPLHAEDEAWWARIGNGLLTTHESDGDWMYGVESCVHPDYRGGGVGSKLMDARFAVLRALNLRGMIAGSAIIDYYKVADTVPVDQYVQEVIAGQRFDTNLSKQLHKGFKAVQLIPHYLDHDWDCQGYGVLIRWDNPEYVAGRAAAKAAPKNWGDYRQAHSMLG